MKKHFQTLPDSELDIMLALWNGHPDMPLSLIHIFEACPFHVMVKAEESPNASKCIACGICVKACPMDVLEIVEG